MDVDDVRVDGPIMRSRAQAMVFREGVSDEEEVLDEEMDEQHSSSTEQDPDDFESESEPECELTSENEVSDEEREPPAKRNKTPATQGRGKSTIEGRGGKNQPKYKWYLKAPETRARGRSSISVYIPKVLGAANNIDKPLAAWSLLFPDNLLNIIVQHTNLQIEAVKIKYPEYARDVAKYRQVDLIEIKALFGLLYLIGTKKESHYYTDELWSEVFGENFCKATMSEHRFIFLLGNLRFDDKSTRKERLKVHGLAPIKEIWDLFIENCKAYYEPSTFVTIDEQLLLFRGRFEGRVCIPKKPAKYGIKIVSCNDVQNGYMIDAEPYTGKGPGSMDNSARHYLISLTRSIHNTCRNVTCDNWFTQVPTVEELRSQYNLTVVGTIRKNKPEIPPSFSKPASAGTVRFAYDSGMTLVSFCPKKNKVVLAISSYHETGKMNELEQKPEIIRFYNKTKYAVDTFDQMCGYYSVARPTNRWPMRIMYGMLDQAGVNSNIIYNFHPINENMARKEFLRELGLALITPHLQRRLYIPTLRITLREIIRVVIGQPLDVRRRPIKFDSGKRNWCSSCPQDRKKRTTYRCSYCERAACDEHRRHVCDLCMQ